MIYICTNKETIAEHIAHEDHEVCLSVAEMLIENLRRVMEDTEYETESSFAAWHGGRMQQFHKVMGLVACDEDDPHTLRDQISDAIHSELVRLLDLEMQSIAAADCQTEAE